MTDFVQSRLETRQVEGTLPPNAEPVLNRRAYLAKAKQKQEL